MKSSDAVEEIKRRVDIVDVVGRVVQLKKAGSNFKGLCPFHREKTPSFVVSESRQTFHCFGCDKGGDVFTFIEEYYNVGFREALERLADECGVTIDRYDSGNAARYDEYYDINRQAAKFFYMAFQKPGNPGREYMKSRGIDDETLKTFGIGYADDSGTGLYQYMKHIGIDESKMLEVGLISQSRGRIFDRFRNRVMFPIFNTRGKIVGFGGRDITGESQAKYINSSESDVFKKRHNLYGLNNARQDIGRGKRAIVVEGYMDVIGLYQCGVRNVCASLGTALTDEQARLLRRYTNNVVLCYDSDEAGRRAALRGIDVLRKAGAKVTVMHVTEGKDPDEYVKVKGRDGFLKLADDAMPSAEYKFRSIAEKYDTDTPEGRIDFMKEAVVFLKSMSPVEADIYIRRLSEEYSISEAAVRREMDSVSTKHSVQPVKRERAPARDSLSNAERMIIRIMLVESVYFERKDEFSEYMESAAGKSILAAMSENYETGKEFDINKIIDYLEDTDENAADVMKKLTQSSLPVGNIRQVYENCVDSMKLDKLQKREHELLGAMEMAEGTSGIPVDKLFSELADVRAKITAVKEKRRI
ncbi:MAG: DNA primase [Anaerovoracaceae bacterium]|jgi:DNA primase